MTCVAFHNGVLYADRMSITNTAELQIYSDICKLYKGKEGKVAVGFCGTLYDEITMQQFTDAIEVVLCKENFNPVQMSMDDLFEFVVKNIDNSHGVLTESKLYKSNVLKPHGIVVTSSHVFYMDTDAISMPNISLPFAVGSGYPMFLTGVFLGHEPKDIYSDMSELDDFMVSSAFDSFQQSNLLPIAHTEKDAS